MIDILHNLPVWERDIPIGGKGCACCVGCWSVPCGTTGAPWAPASGPATCCAPPVTALAPALLISGVFGGWPVGQ